jgi:hypothetical protein
MESLPRLEAVARPVFVVVGGVQYWLLNYLHHYSMEVARLVVARLAAAWSSHHQCERGNEKKEMRERQTNCVYSWNK